MEWMVKTMPLDIAVQMASNIRNTWRGMVPGMVGLKMEVELFLFDSIFGTKSGRATGSEALAPKRGENKPDLGNMSLNLIGVSTIFFRKPETLTPKLTAAMRTV